MEAMQSSTQKRITSLLLQNEHQEKFEDKVDLKIFLREIRKCTDIKELTPIIVNTLIKRIEIHNPEIIDGQKKVKVDISFTAVGLISIPDSKELLHLMDEIHNKKVRKNGLKRCNRYGYTASCALLSFRVVP